MRRQLQLGLSALILAAAPVAADPLQGFLLVGQTAHFTFYSRASQKVDGGKVEKQLERVCRLLEQPFEGRADMYRYPSAGDVAAVTGLYAGGVTYGDKKQVHVTETEQDHEIVHLVAYSLGNPGAFFQEGLAVALGDHGKYIGRDVDQVAHELVKRGSLSTWVKRFDARDPQEGYAVAGSFVGWLIKHHGVTSVAKFFRACHGQDREARFAEVFGQTLTEAGSAWAAQV